VVGFSDLYSTAENFAVVIRRWLHPHLAAHLHLSVTCYETDRNFVEHHAYF